MPFAWRTRYLIVVAVVLFAMLDWPGVIAAACANMSAYHLSQALVGQGNRQDDLQKSLKWSKEALKARADSVSATRLSLLALVEGEGGLDLLPFEASEVVAKGDAMSVLYLGELMRRAGREEEALAVWRSIENTECYFANTGDRAYADGNTDSALVNYRISLAIRREPFALGLQMYINLCDYEIRRENYDEAIAWCTEAIKIRRTVYDLLRLGRVYVYARDYSSALPILEEARDLEGSIGGVHYYLALTYRGLGDLDLALRSYERALLLSPTNQYINFSAGGFYVRLGELQRAYCCYKRVLQHGSSQGLLSTAREKLEELKKTIPVPTCHEITED